MVSTIYPFNIQVPVIIMESLAIHSLYNFDLKFIIHYEHIYLGQLFQELENHLPQVKSLYSGDTWVL